MDKKQKAREIQKLSASKKKFISSNPELLCNKEVATQLDRLSDSTIAEITAHNSIFGTAQTVAKKEDLDEKITTLEQSLADKAAQLNNNHTFKEEEKEDIRKLKPELQNMKSQLQLEKEQLIMEKAQLEQLLKEKEQLMIKNAGFEKRLMSAEEKLNDFSNEINKSSDRTSNINSLPDEIMIKLFSYFKLKKLCQIRRVCRRWNVLSTCPVLWKRINVPLHISKKSQKCLVNSLPCCVTQMRMEFYNSLKRGWNFKEFCVSLSEKCPNLTTLILYKAKMSECLLSVIDLCTEFLHDLRALIFYDCNFYFETRKTECCSISKIEILDIFMCGIFQYDRYPFFKLSQLKQLSLCYTSFDTLWFEGNKSFLNTLNVLDLNNAYIGSSVFEAIKNEGHNLKELYLCDSILSDSDFTLNSAVFPYLETICLQGSYVTCKAVISLLYSCRSLKNVHVDEDVAESCWEHPYISNECKKGIVKVVDCLSQQKHCSDDI